MYKIWRLLQYFVYFVNFRRMGYLNIKYMLLTFV